jgi:hypothetical protein
MNPVVVIDKSVTWYGMPWSEAVFKTENGSIQTKFHPIIRFVGRKTSRKIYGLLEMNKTTDESVEESVKWVNENYYTNHVQKNLNEGAIYTINGMDTATGTPMYGTVVGTNELKRLLVRNISQQLNLGSKFRAKRIKRKLDIENSKKDIVRPILVWGAPGIGKTKILKSSIYLLKNSKF